MEITQYSNKSYINRFNTLEVYLKWSYLVLFEHRWNHHRKQTPLVTREIIQHYHRGQFYFLIGISGTYVVIEEWLKIGTGFPVLYGQHSPLSITDWQKTRWIFNCYNRGKRVSERATANNLEIKFYNMPNRRDGSVGDGWGSLVKH